VLRQAARPPEAPRRDLDQGHQGLYDAGEGPWVLIGPPFPQPPAEFRVRQRLVRQDSVTDFSNLLRVRAGEPAPPGKEHAIEHRLDGTAQRVGIAGRDEMDRSPHQRQPDQLPRLDEAFQVGRTEPADAAPQGEVRVPGLLSLEADDMLHDARDRGRRPLEQVLAREEGSVHMGQRERPRFF
jgi:hypothetical protein